MFNQDFFLCLNNIISNYISFFKRNVELHPAS